jgi:hypothetical protein
MSSRNPEFTTLIEKVKATHESKSHDYASDNNVFSNFEYAAQVAGITVDQVFMTLIGVKLARLIELLSGKTPKNESIDDTFLDLTCYSAIWGSYRTKLAKKEAENLINIGIQRINREDCTPGSLIPTKQVK